VYEALWPSLQTAGVAVQVRAHSPASCRPHTPPALRGPALRGPALRGPALRGGLFVSGVGCTAQVALASDRRAGEFRDVPDGRQCWEAAIGRHRASKAAARNPPRKESGIATSQNGHQPGPTAPKPATAAGARASRASAAATGGGAGGGAAAAATTAAGAAGTPGSETAAVAPSKRRVVSGPACECCDVRFSGEAQLDEHKLGRRHSIALAALNASPPPTLAIESRHAPLEPAALAAAFGKYGPLARRVATIPPRAPRTASRCPVG